MRSSGVVGSKMLLKIQGVAQQHKIEWDGVGAVAPEQASRSNRIESQWPHVCMYILGGASIGGDEYDKIDVRLMGFVRPRRRFRCEGLRLAQ